MSPPAPQVPKTDRIVADNPIQAPSQDFLGRSKPAQTFAWQVLAMDANQGAVVAVLGPWGSGKTSFLNLARVHLEASGVQILDFNPWMFSGAEQLVESFFVEMASQLKLKAGLGEIAKDLEEYGESFSGMSWLPIVGPWIERGKGATKVLSKILQRREGIGGRRGKVALKLAELDRPIAVVLDDIDRLTTSEIRDVFRLVRLTANFPNVIYLLAFDRSRVETALAEHGIPGRDYLEKILQVAVDLPVVPSAVFNRQVFDALNRALANVEERGAFDQERWPDVFVEVIRPLLRNMRDVRRYVAAVSGTFYELAEGVALVDLLGLEAIRVFLPDVFALLHLTVEGLTTTSGDGQSSRDSAHLKEQVDRLIVAAGPHTKVVLAIVERLFPAAERHMGGSHYGHEWKRRWLRERRVAHDDVLRLYLERVVGEDLQAFIDSEKAWALMGDHDAFQSRLESLDAERLRDVISSLEVYEDKFKVEHVVSGSTVLLNMLPKMPERDRGMFDFDDSMVVGRVVYRLVRTVKNLDDTEKVVRMILPKLTTLSSKAQLMGMVGHREGLGHKLVTEEAAKKLEQEWRAEVRSALPESLMAEPELLRIIYTTIKEASGEEPSFHVEPSVPMTLALLRSARGETKTQPMGSRAVRRSPRLAWDVLTEVYGGEDVVRARIGEVQQARVDGTDDLMELVGKYLRGWRPSRYPDDDE